MSAPATGIRVVGIDIGSKKTMTVVDDGEIILTETGSTSTPSMVSFSTTNGKTIRVIGEEAEPFASNENTLQMPNLLLGISSLSDIESSPLHPFRKTKLQMVDGKLACSMDYNGSKDNYTIEQCNAILLIKIYDRIRKSAALNASGDNIVLSFALPPNFSAAQKQSILDSCYIANIPISNVTIVDKSDCIVSAYSRKLSALRSVDMDLLVDKTALLIDCGHTQTTMVVVYIAAVENLTKISFEHINVGGNNFDLQLYDHFVKLMFEKHKTQIEIGSKKSQRLLGGCEKIRKLLSQLPQCSITIDNMTDNGDDVTLSLKREEFMMICKDLLTSFQEAVKKTTNGQTIAAVEIFGGTSRMPILQTSITEVTGINILGAKFDDGSIALGAGLYTIAKLLPLTSTFVNETVFTNMTSKANNNKENVSLEKLRLLELDMQVNDNNLLLILGEKYKIESKIFEMRNNLKGKYGNLIDSSKLNKLLDDAENWLYDTDLTATLSDLTVYFETLSCEVNVLCKEYFDKLTADKLAVEEQLNIEAAKAEVERGISGDDDDHDNRKLRKPERMRLVVKNKEEGTELFKGSNWKQAASRYHKALQHCQKFFDITKDDEAEIKAIKITLYLNLASCYIKLQFWEQVLNNCNDAISLDAKNPKAFFRRASYYENKKEWEKAMDDMKTCQKLSEVPDVNVTKGIDRIKKEIQKENDTAKKTWGRAFM